MFIKLIVKYFNGILLQTVTKFTGKYFSSQTSLYAAQLSRHDFRKNIKSTYFKSRVFSLGIHIKYSIHNYERAQS